MKWIPDPVKVEIRRSLDALPDDIIEDIIGKVSDISTFPFHYKDMETELTRIDLKSYISRCPDLRNLYYNRQQPVVVFKDEYNQLLDLEAKEKVQIGLWVVNDNTFSFKRTLVPKEIISRLL